MSTDAPTEVPVEHVDEVAFPEIADGAASLRRQPRCPERHR